MVKKKCSRCRKKKVAELDFNRNSSKPDGYQPYCRVCQNKRDRQLYNESEERRSKVRSRNNAQRDVLREIVEKERAKGCTCCPEKTPCCMKFHHVNGKDKDLEVSVAVERGWSIKRLLKEMAKCVVVCGNCHDKIHAGLIALGCGATGSAAASEAVG